LIDIKEILRFTKNLKILYIEDNKETRESTLVFLEELFDDIAVATDGLEGLEYFKNVKDIDMIITDINMPNMNGLEMSKKIKEEKPNLPIFIFSAHNEADFLIEAIEIGIEGFIFKPIEINQFLNTLYKTIKMIKITKENLDYKYSLEEKVKIQIEELRTKDTLLAQNVKMAAMGEMIDSIAHQWTQPISVIKIALDSLELNVILDNITNEKVLKAISVSTLQIEHLTNTMHEFRSFFSPNDKLVESSIVSLIDSTLLLMKDELQKHMIIVEVLGDKYTSIFINKNEFKHVIINLINNAKDAFSENNISQEDRKIIVNIKNNENNIILSVEDTAGGIPIDVISNIFKLYFTTKEEGKGTGVGLYMTKKIIEKMGASIEVTNATKGAMFTINMPKVQSD